MITIRWKILGLKAGTPLCVTCSWGLVRKGKRAEEEQTFCRLIEPHSAVPFAVSECSGYFDRRAPNAAQTARRFGFTAGEATGEGVEVIAEKAEKK
jgi:hypothetical protein